MRKIIFFTLISFLFSCKQKDENLDLKYEVLNQLIAEDIATDKTSENTRNYIYKSYSATSFSVINLDKEKLDDNILIANLLTLKSDSILSPNDIDYLISQTVPYDSKEFDLDRRKVHGNLNIIKSADLNELHKNYKGADDYWEKFKNKFGNKCIRSYSEPIFNLKKEVCIVRISESCGSLEGGGRTIFYKKVNGKWKEITSQDFWVS